MKLNQREIKNLLKKENPIIVEIGAHKGYDTKRFLDEFKDIKIYCFEPDPRCIKEFKNHINDKRCTLIEAAISNKDGEATLNMSSGYHPGKLSRFYNILKATGLIKWIIRNKEDWDFSSSIKRAISNSKYYPWLEFHKTTKVKTIKLDTWTKQNNLKIIDFIWADIQGAEKEMIEGGINTLKIVKYIFTEYGEIKTYPEALSRDQTIELLKKYDFQIVKQYSTKGESGNLLFENSRL